MSLTARRRPRVLAAAAALSLLVPLSAQQPPAANAADGLRIGMTAQTGTPAFDQTDGDGFDSSADNMVIRTNDIVTYRVNVAATPATAGDGTLTLTLPVGQEFRTVPAWCNDPANPAVDATPTPAMSAPVTPLTATSWQSLPQQTLTCAIGDVPAASALFFEIPAYQRPEVPNDTVLPTAVATIATTTAPTPTVTTEDLAMTVSAGPRWDLSKNGMNLQENSFVMSPSPSTCEFDPTQSCMDLMFPLLISGAGGAKGHASHGRPVATRADLAPSRRGRRGRAPQPRRGGSSRTGRLGGRIRARAGNDDAPTDGCRVAERSGPGGFGGAARDP